MKTFKQLQDEVLEGMGDAEDAGTPQSIVQTEIRNAQNEILGLDQWDFMLWPWSETISVLANTKTYALHPLFDKPFYFFDTTIGDYLEVVPPKSLLTTLEDPVDGEAANPMQVMLTSVSGILQRASGVVTVTTTGGTESAGNSVVVQGISGGAYTEETLSSASAWSTIVGSTTFTEITGITKVGSTWSRTITVTIDGTTLIVLGASQFGRELQQLEFIANPTAANTISYRFYRKPRKLERDNDIPEIPEQFVDLLSLKAKLQTTGLSRPPQEEIEGWQRAYDQLLTNLRQTHSHPRALNSRARYITYHER